MWQDLTNTTANKQYRCHRFARLVNDAGVILGSIMQFYEGGPCYAMLADCRLGPHQTWAEAQTAVENPEKANPLAYFRTHPLDG